MNFLAHLYLSPENSEIRLGNFIADSVKGSHLYEYSPDVQKGILLHRKIDVFTDVHSEVKKCVERLKPHFRLYSPVVVDIYFDHFLAKNWEKYSSELLGKYAEKQYQLIENYRDILPERVKTLFNHMKSGNWLYNYQHLDFLEKVFAGMTRRTPYISNMQQATEVLSKDYTFFENSFFNFFPDLCKEFLTQNSL